MAFKSPERPEHARSVFKYTASVESGDVRDAPNVAAMHKGTGDSYVIITAHYDHLKPRRFGEDRIYNGADDNASGSSAVLLLARLLSEHYASSEDTSMRSILILFFDAEEAGLLGSAHYVSDPSIDLDKVNVMLNMDMVARLRNNTLMLGGTGTAVEFETIVPEVFTSSTLIGSLSPSGTGPSDHANFYKEDIPVLFFFTGMTEEYHTPTDRASTVNPSGGATVTQLAEVFAKRFIDEDWLTFTTNARGGSSRPTSMPSQVRLGVHPSYSAEIETGILLTGVYLSLIQL